MLPVMLTVVFSPAGVTVGGLLADPAVRDAWAVLRATRPSNRVSGEQWRFYHDAAGEYNYYIDVMGHPIPSDKAAVGVQHRYAPRRARIRPLMLHVCTGAIKYSRDLGPAFLIFLFPTTVLTFCSFLPSFPMTLSRWRTSERAFTV